MKRTAYLTAALAALALASCSKPQPIELVTVKPERGNVSVTVTATGTLESVTQVDVGTQVTGIIDKIYVDYNSQVTQGQLLAEIEKTILQSTLKSADANLESARVTYDYCRKNYERDKALHDKQLISDYEFDTSKKEYETAKLAYEKSTADRVGAAKNLNYAEIYSPIDGIVISREVEVGQTVVSNMSVANLFVIADLDNMQVVANVDEADIGQVKEHQKVTFTVDAYPDDVFQGTVTQVRLSPTTESNVVTYEVVVSAANPDHKLIPGLTANLTIYVQEETDVLTLPVKALKFTPHDYEGAKGLPAIACDPQSLPAIGEGEARVWVKRDGKLQPVTVKTGANNGVTVAITSGLSDSDAVALEYSSQGGGDSPAGAPDGQAEAAGGSSGDTESSPFAPKPPGSNKKK